MASSDDAPTDPLAETATGTEDTLSADLGTQDTMLPPLGAEDPVLKADLRRRLFEDDDAEALIGRFEIREELGRGGMGVVYRARDPQLDRDVALKLLSPTIAQDETARARLQREARAMARVTHPHVAVVHEVGEHEGSVFIVMELVEGVTLRGWLATRPPPNAIVSMFVQTGQGLLAAHQAGLVHRDFKPDNVLVGDDERPRVVDFGLARGDVEVAAEPVGTVSPDPDSTVSTDLGSTLSVAGTIAGTPAYMSPEQFQGQATDARSDQYSFCVALYEALYERRPFDGENLEALRRQVLGGELPQDKAPSEVAARLLAVLRRGLAREPRDRFGDMDALLRQLEPRAPRRGNWLLPAVGVLGLGIAGAAVWLGDDDAAVVPTTPSEDVAKDAPTQRILAASELPQEVLEALPGDSAAVTVRRLENGLTVYIASRRDVPRIEGRFVFRVGSANDSASAPGTADLLARVTEHGTAKLGASEWASERPIRAEIEDVLGEQPTVSPAALERAAELEARAAPFVVSHEYQTLLNELGATGDVYVDGESTTVSVEFPAAHLEAWLRLEGERLRQPVFRGYLRELNHLEERRQQDASDADGVLFSAVPRLLYPDSPFGPSARGPEADASLPSIAALRELHSRWYVPNNAAVVLVGDVDPEAAVALVARVLGDWAPVPLNERPVRPAADDPTGTVVADLGNNDHAAAWRIPDARDPAARARLAALDLLEQHLFDNVDEFGILPVFIRAPSYAAMTTYAGDEKGKEEVRRVLAAARALAAEPVDVDEWHRGAVAGQTHAVAIDRRLADTLADVFTSHTEWARFVDELSEPPSAAAVQSALRHLGTVYLEIEDGPADAPPKAELPPLQPGPPAKGRSEFAAAVLAVPAPTSEPRFIVEGRHYWVRQGPGGTIVAAECDRGMEHIELNFTALAGTNFDVCAPLMAGSLAFFLQLSGSDSRAEEVRASVNVTCSTGTGTGLLISAPSGSDLSPFFVDPSTWFSTPHKQAQLAETLGRIGPSVGQRMQLTQSDVLLAHGRALQAARGIPQIRFPTGAGATPSVADVLKAWGQIEKFQIEVGYCGHDPKGFLETTLIDAPKKPRPAASNLVVTTDRPGRQFYAAHASGRAVVQIHIAFGPEAKVPGPAMAAILERMLNRELRGPLLGAVQSDDGFDLDVSIGQSSPDERAALTIGVEAERATAIAALQRALEFLDRGATDLAEVERARADVEREIRHTRIPSRDIPATVFEWRREKLDSDPRMELWAGLAAVDDARVTAMSAQARSLPMVVSMAGPWTEADLAAIRELGTLHLVE